MAKTILEAELKVSGITHKKKTKEGEHEYKYGAIVLHNPILTDYIGKVVKVKILKQK